jgi:hypothetical protein
MNMKKLVQLVGVALMLVISTRTMAQEQVVWQELEDFHDVMSQTWHPVEEGNFAPIRERSGELASKADAWKKSKIPAQYAAQKDIKKNLNMLAKETAELNKEIAKGCSDEEIKEELHELHELFHTIVGLCKD